ncbi:MAG: histidine phosphatase family protein [Dermatophilaceae bacterium]
MPRSTTGPDDARAASAGGGRLTPVPEGAPAETGEADVTLAFDDAKAAAPSVGLGTRPPHVGDPAAQVLLVRHGVTAFTTEGRLDGRGGSDPSLSAAGQAQAVTAGQAVTAVVGDVTARVVTSSLARAVQTGSAVSVALGVEATIDADWDEQSFGDWDGRTFRELVDKEPHGMRALGTDSTYRPPGGETHDELVARVLPAWNRVVAAGGTTVVVCHRTPILVVLAEVLGLGHERARRLAAAPGSVTAVEVWDDGEASVVFTNRT